MSAKRIRVGIGGWTYVPWRDTFYPPGTVQSRELDYASRQVTSIEINGTFYGLQRPEVFAKWHAATPADFLFSVKAPRFIVQRKDLSGAASAVERFFASGLTELGAKLGPLLWQLAPTKKFDAREVDAFLGALPKTLGKLPLRHALEVRHASFLNGEFLAILRQYDIAAVLEDDAAHPGFADVTSSFVYARLRRCAASIATGYSPKALQQWSRRAQGWAKGREPADLPRIAPRPAKTARAAKIADAADAADAATKSSRAARPLDVFIYFINGAKERAPAAAQKLIALLGEK